MLAGEAFRVSIGARGGVVVDLRPLVPLDNLRDLVTDDRLRPIVDAELGLLSVLALPPPLLVVT